MDLVILSTNQDFVAVKSKGCYNCLETKLNTKVIRVFTNALSIKEFVMMKKESNLQGFDITCVCKK